MPVIGFLRALVAGQLHLFGIDHDHMITAIHIRCVARFVFAAHAQGDERGHAAQHQIFCIDNEPFFLDVFRRCDIGPWQRHMGVSNQGPVYDKGRPEGAHRQLELGYRRILTARQTEKNQKN